MGRIARTFRVTKKDGQYPTLAVRILASLCALAIASDGLFQFSIVHTVFAPRIYIALMQFAALVFMVFFPHIGAWISIAAWLISCILPESPYSIIFGCLLACGYLGYCSVLEGLGAYLLSILLYFPSIDAAANSEGASFFSITLFLATSVGIAMRKHHDIQSRLRKQQRQMETKRIIHDLHDHVTNDLADALMLIQAREQTSTLLEPHDEELLKKLLMDAFSTTHSVVKLLEPDLAKSPVDDSLALPLSYSKAPSSLRALVEERKLMLTELGFTGTVIIDGTASSSLSKEAEEYTGNLLRELFGNIVKHADPQHGYALTLALTNQRITIGLTDIAASNTPHSAIGSSAENKIEGSHSGLRRFQQEIKSSGGTWTEQMTGDRWTLHIQMPTTIKA